MGLVDQMEDLASVDFRAVLRAKARKDWNALTETSLSRVWKHVGDAKETSYAILTSDRRYEDDGKTPRTHKTKQVVRGKLQQDLRSMGLTWTKLIGHWRECTVAGKDYKDCAPEELEDTKEVVYMVPGLSKAQALKLGRKYNQDAVIWAGPESEGKTLLIFQDGSEHELGAFTPSVVRQGYSQVKGKTFAFEALEYPAQSWIEAIIEQSERAKSR